MKRRTMLGWSLLAIGTVMAISSAVIEKPGSISWHDKFSYQKAGALKTTDLSQQLPPKIEDIKKLTIDSSDKAVYIERGDHFAITETHIGNDDKTKVTYSNGTLAVKNIVRSNHIISFDWRRFSEDQTRLTITVPDSVQLKAIHVTQSNGDTTLSDIRADDIQVQSENDDVTLARVVAKNAKINLENGEAKLHQLTVDNLQVQSENDDVTLAASTIKTIKTELQNGDAEIANSQILDGGYIRNENGDISIETTKLPTFSARTEIGDTEVAPAFVRQQGGKGDLIIQNQNGDIEIE
ncbi:DUF4097 family beta strand repeat-containing protein [Leuconostoc rapi]|uniref:DUF4097 family beta strand repeat-containing protein n=1 Tax=Leuconostoc rapi TaxID=1406906 RepID=UPI001959DEF2|nr:DUF4097 family beta strand repeat-containing protein [Leuconostoc rapi]MBM7436219.1 DUF4097 and DUF4098 domain-containing protein YvlB [Leuconostoc rapi]